MMKSFINIRLVKMIYDKYINIIKEYNRLTSNGFTKEKTNEDDEEKDLFSQYGEGEIEKINRIL